MKVEIKNLIFGPDDSIEQFVISEIDNAEKEIYFMVFWFTWKPIADAIIRANARGVSCKLLLDSRSTEIKLKDCSAEEVVVPEYLVKNGLPLNNIRIYDGELLHHKIILLDSTKTMMGSCNFFNGSLNRHEESYMLIEGPDLNSSFLKRYQQLWKRNSKKFILTKHNTKAYNKEQQGEPL